MLIETRREEALRFIVPNTVSRMPRGWGLTVFHAPGNAAFVREVCAGIDNVELVCLAESIDLSDFRNYNRLLTTPGGDATAVGCPTMGMLTGWPAAWSGHTRRSSTQWVSRRARLRTGTVT